MKKRFLKFIMTICVVASLTLSVGFVVKGLSGATLHRACGSGTCEEPDSIIDCSDRCTSYPTCIVCCRVKLGLSLIQSEAYCRQFFFKAVGGTSLSVDNLDSLAPYFGLASTILVATVATSIYAKRVKCRKEK